MNQTFHLGDVLSITTGRLVAREGMQAVYRILNYMTDDSVFTHQLGRVAEECKPHLLAQHPKLKAIDADAFTGSDWKAWLADQVMTYGEYLEVAPLAKGEHYYIDPISELAEKVHPSKIVVVKAGRS